MNGWRRFMKRPSDYIIEKYFNDYASKEDAEIVMEWLNTKEGSEYLDEHLFNEDDGISSHKGKFLFTDAALQKLESKIDAQKEKISLAPKRKGFSLAWYIAASLVILLIIVPVLKFTLQEKQLVEVAPAIKMEFRKNPQGQKSLLSLPDGSRIKLNAESSIEFAEGLQGKTRLIKLRGEAFFEVAEDSTRPFVVQLYDSIRVMALGTSFNISAYNDDDNIEVALATGKVQVQNYYKNLLDDNNEQILSPGEAYQFNKKNGEAKNRKFDLRKTLGWKDGILYFNDTPFKEIHRTLERWYGVDIQLNKSENRIASFTGEFKDETLKNVLENMSVACKFKYGIKGKKVIIF